MSRSICAFVLSVFLVCSSTESAKVGLFSATKVPDELGYFAGPLPLLRLKKYGFDVEHMPMRQMSSPSPAPRKNCDDEQQALQDACDDVNKKEKKLKNIRKDVKKAKKELEKAEKKLEKVKKQIKDERKKISRKESEIAGLEADLEFAVLTQAGRDDIEKEIERLEDDIDSINKKLRKLKRKENRTKPKVRRARMALSKKEDEEESAEDEVTQADLDKKEAQRLLDVCLASLPR